LAKLAELVEPLEMQEFDIEVLAYYLCGKEEGVPIAARLLRNYLLRADEKERIWGGILQVLLHARCWSEIIRLHEAGRLEKEEVHSILCVALAHWAENGEMPESLCRQALEMESDDELLRMWPTDDQEFHLLAFETKSWLLWRVGKVVEAIADLDKAEERARGATDLAMDDMVFSMWRLRTVSVEQYLDDCRLLRRMFQGEPLRPAFLGPASATTPV
jgi:hypothetical protein